MEGSSNGSFDFPMSGRSSGDNKHRVTRVRSRGSGWMMLVRANYPMIYARRGKPAAPFRVWYATTPRTKVQMPAPPKTTKTETKPVRTLLGKFWTIPNMLSLARLALAVPITYLILVDASLPLLFVLLGISIVTDYFDGRVARWSRTVSEWGKVLDPLADKVTAIAVTLALVIRGSLPGWFFLLVAGRDVIIVLGGIILARKRGVVVMSMWIGKVAVTAVAVTTLAALLKADPPVMTFCIWTTSVLLIASFAAYAARYVRLMRGDPDTPSHSPGMLHGFLR